MSGPACVALNGACGARKAHPVHGKLHPAYHPYDSGLVPFDRQPRARLSPRSPKTEAYYRETRLPAVAAAQGRPCEAAIDGVCIGGQTPARDLHEIVSRAQAGSLPLAAELGTMVLCRACHDKISTEPEWAREQGFRLTRRDVGLT